MTDQTAAQPVPGQLHPSEPTECVSPMYSFIVEWNDFQCLICDRFASWDHRRCVPHQKKWSEWLRTGGWPLPQAVPPPQTSRLFAPWAAGMRPQPPPPKQLPTPTKAPPPPSTGYLVPKAAPLGLQLPPPGAPPAQGLVPMQMPSPAAPPIVVQLAPGVVAMQQQPQQHQQQQQYIGQDPARDAAASG